MVAALIAIGLFGIVVVVRSLRHEDDVHALARAGDIERLRALLDRAPERTTALNRDGEAPIHTASKAGRIDILDLLRERGADVNSRTEEGVTPLHFASAFNEIACVQWLLDHGANLSAKESSGLTPLDAARARGHGELVIFLQGRNSSQRLVDETLARWLSRPSAESEAEAGAQIREMPMRDGFQSRPLS